MKIMLFDPTEDLPLEAIENILQKAISLYKTGVIKITERSAKLNRQTIFICDESGCNFFCPDANLMLVTYNDNAKR
jgi:hypothetical protein